MSTIDFTPKGSLLDRGGAGRPTPRPPRTPRRLALGAIVVVAVVAAVLSQSAHRRAGQSQRSDDRAGTGRHDRPAGAASGRQASLAGTPPYDLPFPRNPADRRTRRGEVPSLYSDGLICSTGCRPYEARIGWPLKPFHEQHPIRAGLNELRPGSLHVGLDVQAPDGTTVYSVQPGVARVLAASGPNARVQVGNYIYWHIDPAVRTGQGVRPFKTILGRIMHGYGHFAFSEVNAADDYVNPLRPGGTVLAPYVNHEPPVIGAPSLAAGGQVVVAAYSPQSFVQRTTYVTPVLAPAAIAYRLYDSQGVALTPLEWAFRGTHLLPWAERSLIYAPGAHAPGFACFATLSVCIPHWSYRVAGGFAPPLPATVAPGRYRLTIYAWDWADNRTALDTTVTMTPTGWRPIGRFPSSLFRLPGYYTQSELLHHLASGPGRVGPYSRPPARESTEPASFAGSWGSRLSRSRSEPSYLYPSSAGASRSEGAPGGEASPGGTRPP